MSSGKKSANEGLQAPSRNSALSDWLHYLEHLHSSEIDLGLERVAAVYERLNQSGKPGRYVITVAGTNGKGSTVCYLAEILQRASYRVGVYTSPHLMDYRERITINGKMLDAQSHVDAFVDIEQARQQTALTYFEFGTLAALYLMQQHNVDVAILEVGLGGRLDAVNIVDADVAVITSIGIDHVQFLGDNREQIGREKAGIARANRPLICGDSNPPKSIAQYAHEIGADVFQTGKQFSYSDVGAQWHYRGIESNLLHLSKPQLPLINAATSIAALECLPLAVSADAIREGIQQAQLVGRMQRVNYRDCDVLLDVGHNPQAAEYLLKEIPRRFRQRQIYAVVGMLKDKDYNQVFECLKPLVKRWYLGTLTEPRGASAEQLAAAAAFKDSASVTTFESVESAFSHAVDDAQTEKPLVFVFGSFYTVGRINQQIRS